jgi:coenzyme F420 hydrogenase subunit beta
VKGLSQIPKVSFEETLGKHVLPSLCIGCGSCVTVCPFNCLDYVDGKPVVAKECKLCGICAQVCPRYNLSVPSLERLVFGRTREENEKFGINRSAVIAQSTDNRILRVAQDGGIVMSLLVYALENGVIDGAVLSGVEETEPLKAVPKLATTAEEILACGGTRYTYSPSMLALRDGVQQKKGKLAFVGTPDQIQAFRRIQAIPLRKYSDAVVFTIGVFCSECFTHDGLVAQLIRGKLGINPSDVKKVNIKGKLLVTTKSGKVESVPLKEVKAYASNCASSCSDFSAELADISVGGVGLDGWTFTVLRTEKGEELFRKIESEGLIRTKPVEEEKKAFELLVKLSRRKREGAARLIL